MKHYNVVNLLTYNTASCHAFWKCICTRNMYVHTLCICLVVYWSCIHGIIGFWKWWTSTTNCLFQYMLLPVTPDWCSCTIQGMKMESETFSRRCTSCTLRCKEWYQLKLSFTIVLFASYASLFCARVLGIGGCYKMNIAYWSPFLRFYDSCF